MKYEQYELTAAADLMYFEFVSVGPKGKIQKIIEYTELGSKNIFNLGFGDKDKLTGKMNDTAITNNGDDKKVLATVAATIYLFTNKYPGALIFATGSTDSRTRLYRIGITNNLPLILQDFNVFGIKNNILQRFEKNKDYDGFVIKRNNLNLLHESQKKNKTNIPGVRIDKSMDKYKGKIIFKEKWEKANKIVKDIEFPEEIYKR